ncbi:AT hook, DNA-binding motif protein [Metarhizium guizhouense ARSEF 977]|uniref:AT hook, DNA-binding motif protein n=1 Tax=Metarhizium guizhouense (strain ARSEF 977) TaxID=1276136 RepID=A0A0B4GAM4_METGA|nr:AT hook, DNA-binding motif protein [Metarhizium guizhouense ARSEF 977]
MTDDQHLETTTKKRGRPRKYATMEEKAAADVSRRRAKRQLNVSLQREQWHTAFYNPALPSVLSPLPPAIGAHTAAAVGYVASGSNENVATVITETDSDCNVQDISGLLPPDSPAAEPTMEGLPTNEGDCTVELDSAATVEPTFTSEHDSAFNDALSDPQTAGTVMPSAHSNSEDEANLSQVTCLPRRLTDQLLAFRGCCADCHRQRKSQHEEDMGQHSSLQAYLSSTAGLCPDILGSTQMPSAADELAAKTDATSRRQIFCGLGEEETPPHICLDEDERVSEDAGVTFDIDSITGLLTSIAVAKQGIRWLPTQMPISDLRSDLHLSPIEVHFSGSRGEARRSRRPIHQVPHYTFGRLIGFEDISLYFLFPRLYREEQQCSRLRDEDFRLWMDGILLPILYEHYSSAHVQHYPSSYDHSRCNATARGVETRSQRVDPVAREQQLMYYLPPERLGRVWDAILGAVQKPGLQHFGDILILLQAKNLKVLTKDTTWERMVSRFNDYWSRSIDSDYITDEFYLDVGKETCPMQASRTKEVSLESAGAAHEPRAEPNAEAETLLYKRCCLESYASDMRHSSTAEHTQKEVFYPFSMLHKSGSLTIETGSRSPLRKAGLLYTQFYPSVKEVFAAGNVYPFTNAAIETLALDKKLRRTWELVGGGLSHQPAALMKAYLYTKLRCHYALHGSVRKSFGLREEHRISRALFHSIDSEFRNRQVHILGTTVEKTENSMYHSFTTETLLRWLRWNINKFCVGFETVYSFQDPHFVTWEHTRVMLMFLRCLQYSYSGGLMQKSGGCWQDVRFQTDTRQSNGLRRVEGLGFQRTMETYGYAWFLDKVDWATFTFRQPHAAYMMFNNPSMQAAYHSRYRQIRDVRIDFIRVDKARQWMADFSSVPGCLDLLETYLQQLCLCAFRKDVFTHVKPVLHPEQMEAAVSGEIPLCYESVEKALKDRNRPPKLAQGHQLAVKNIDVLFSWLWEWKDAQFQRKGWDDKPYRMLYRQSFYAISTIRGKQKARNWRQELKRSFFRSHWMLPYPQKQAFMRKDKETKEFVWWSSYHQGLHEYYKRFKYYNTLPHPLPESHIQHHPGDGWRLAPRSFDNKYMPYVVEPETHLLRQSEDELYDRLLLYRENWSNAVDRSAPQATSVFEFNLRSFVRAEPVPGLTWDPICTARTLEEVDTASECSLFLRQELDKYEALQHHQVNTRWRRKRKAVRKQDSSGSEAETSTTDEESLSAKQRQQAMLVRRVESRMRELIELERQQAPARIRSELNADIEKKYNHRLDRVESCGY